MGAVLVSGWKFVDNERMYGNFGDGAAEERGKIVEEDGRAELVRRKSFRPEIPDQR